MPSYSKQPVSVGPIPTPTSHEYSYVSANPYGKLPEYQP